MTLPTLLQTGFVVPPKKATKSEKNRINNITGIDYFINFISDRVPVAGSAPPKIPPKKAGDKVFVLKSGTGSGKSTFPIEQHFAKYDVPDYIQYCVNKAEELHVKNISDIEEKSEFRDILNIYRQINTR
jgi:hypothetical protein